MDYDLEARADAAEDLAPISQGGFGQVVTLHQPASGGTYNPATDTTTGGTAAQNHTGSGVEDRYSAFSIASGAVEATDIKFLLSALKADGTVMPEPEADSWAITLADGKRHTIKRVGVIRPAGTAVMYELQVSGG